MRCFFSYKILLFLSLLTAFSKSYAQQKQPSSVQKKQPPTAQITELAAAQIKEPSAAQEKQASAESLSPARFIAVAPVLVPQLVAEKKWEQLENFLENWRRSGASGDELIFSLDVLSSVENKIFTVAQLPCDAFRYLDDYARDLRSAEETPASFHYSILVSARHWYDASEDARKLLLFIQDWSRRLRAGQSSGSSELFLCQVMAGEIRYPTSELIKNRGGYFELNNFRINMDSYYNRVYQGRRDRAVMTAALTAGIWSPTHNLSVLGDHPSVGLLFGARFKQNEFDIVLSFRFLHPTPRPYIFVRDDTAYSTHYYDGGYFGMDYTKYIFHTGRLELGLTTAAGYDFFDVTDGFKDDNAIAHLEPFNEGSFDFSNGLRLKYYSRRGTFIGLAAKYHLIHYVNTGGTDLSGNAFSIDLLWGIH